jgi:glycosyltransferase involved in cell wall biosynthesis
VTTCRALSALQAQPGKDLLAYDDPDRFAEAVLRLIADRSLQQRIGDAAVTHVRTHHNWTSIASQLLTIYQEISSSKT